MRIMKPSTSGMPKWIIIKLINLLWNLLIYEFVVVFFLHTFRFLALSFRNPEEFSNLDWQMRSRIAPLRNRREIRAKRLSNETIIKNANDTSQIILPANITLPKQNSTEIDIQRSKRETPECVINYNSVRQLFVGCSQSNVIEVKPHCSDDGDEGKRLFDSY